MNWEKLLEMLSTGPTMRAEAEARTPEYNAEILKMFAPEDASELGLMAMSGPGGKLVKLGGLALAGGSYAPEAEAGGVVTPLYRYLKELVAKGEIPADLVGSIRRMQQATRSTGNEHAVYQGTGRLLTSNHPREVAIPPDALANLARIRGGMQAHTHPSGLSAVPSEADFTASTFTPNARALVMTPGAQPKYTSYKSLGRGQQGILDPKMAKQYEEWVDSHVNDRRALDWAEENGLIDENARGQEFKPFAEWLGGNSPLLYLRDQELRGKMLADYNIGDVSLPLYGGRVPGGPLLDQFYFDILDK